MCERSGGKIVKLPGSDARREDTRFLGGFAAVNLTAKISFSQAKKGKITWL